MCLSIAKHDKFHYTRGFQPQATKQAPELSVARRFFIKVLRVLDSRVHIAV